MDHPRHDEIDQDLISGMSGSKVAKKYGVSHAVVTRYTRWRLAEAVAEANRKRRQDHGETVLTYMQRMLDTLEKMRSSLVEYLTDPDDDTKFYVGPRAEEIEVVYDAPRRNNAGVYREKRKLSTLLEELRDAHPEYEFVEVNIKTTDARKLLLDTVNATTRQLELWVNAEHRAQEVAVNDAVRGLMERLLPLLAQASEKNPEMRAHVAELVRSVRANIVLGTGRDVDRTKSI